MRAILIDWLVQVSLKFRLLQETMYMTVGIIDRFLQVGGKSPPQLSNHGIKTKLSFWGLLIPTGPPSPQEAAAACWCHSHVSCFQI